MSPGRPGLCGSCTCREDRLQRTAGNVLETIDQGKSRHKLIIIIIIFICKVPYIRKYLRSEAHKIRCNTYIFKMFIIS